MKRIFFSIVVIIAIVFIIMLPGCDHKYTVTFVDYDGSIIATETVRRNKSVKTPKDPVRESHIFIGWDQELNNINQDLETKALYHPKYVNVTFKDYNGMIFKVDQIEYGEDATPPSSPTREGYQFMGWDQELTNLKTNKVINAVYEINHYTVTFLDYFDNVITTQIVQNGSSCEYPIHDEIVGFEFVGWSHDVSIVKSNLEVKAIYHPHQYQVLFKDDNGLIIKSEYVNYGRTAVAPTLKNREGYTFTGWSSDDYQYVTEDLIVTALYEINKFTVTFKDNDMILKEEKVNYWADATPPLLEEKLGYTFIGWDQNYQKVTSDLVIQAVFNRNQYYVTFLDDHDVAIKIQQIPYGEKAIAPTNINREGKTFVGWDREFDYITSDLNVKAVYQINQYIVTFIINEVEITQTVIHGEDAVLPNVMVQEGLVHTGWDQNHTNITSSKTIRALFVPKIYTVIFKNHQGLIIDYQFVQYGNDAYQPEIPHRTGYQFISWDQNFKNVTSDLVVNPVYQIDKYSVTFEFLNGNNSLVISDVEYNSTIPLSTPTREGYDFSGWYLSAEYGAKPFYENDVITNNTTLYAHWRINFLRYVIENNQITIIGIVKNTAINHIVIPKYIDGYQVKTIEKDAFKNNSSIITIELPAGLTEIGDSAFENMARLSRITIPNTVVNIGVNILKNSNELSTLTMPGHVSVKYLFGAVISPFLVKVNIAEGSNHLVDKILYDANQVTMFHIPSSVISLGENIIETTMVSSIDLSQNTSLNSIGNNVFLNATYLVSIYLPSSVSKIGSYAFANTSIKNIELPQAITEIGEYAFKDAKSLVSITIPKLVTEIKKGTFKNTESLITVCFHNEIFLIGNEAFFGAKKLNNVTLPLKLTHIGNEAFKNTTSLTNITFNQSLMMIGSYAFEDSGSKVFLDIPISVSHIGDYAFKGNDLLTVNFYRDLNSYLLAVGINIFGDHNRIDFIISVPSTCTSQYKNLLNLSVYQDIII